MAAIVILGIRTYFVQPFKIPTNSMWPTYYGMTAENLRRARRRPAWPDGFRLPRLRRPAPGGDRAALRRGVGPVLRTRTGWPTRLRERPHWLVFPTQVQGVHLLRRRRAGDRRVPRTSTTSTRWCMETFFGGERRFAAYWTA